MEWQIVTVIMALIGLIGGITTPIIKLIGTISQLTASVDSLKEDVNEFKYNIKETNKKNSESHSVLWKKNEEQDKAINNQETRIEILERCKDKHDTE